ncbi:DUF6527 family protein [Microbacterium sp.]|uniref:DUF6527 family protein n=1 Tax=Microbacterium sp. TaxID=51671 RepID=UPI001AC951E7|nr:DUF6527 family protein [Microbacterium sp.]MBN9158130.1 hypothetical protein [Microbacterium sp.]
MKRRDEVGHRFVDLLPPALEPGVVYISGTHNIAAHLCCCGCGEEIVTPLGKAGWMLHYDGQVTLSPSVGNGALACRSHYIIRDSRIHWLSEMTAEEHVRANARDRSLAREVNPRQAWRLSRTLKAIFNRLR